MIILCILFNINLLIAQQLNTAHNIGTRVFLDTSAPIPW